jgi:hypothetical protein
LGKSQALGKSLSLQRAQARAVIAVTRAETATAMIHDPIIEMANPPLPKLANQNQSQIADQLADRAHALPHHGHRVVINACAGKNNNRKDVLIRNRFT